MISSRCCPRRKAAATNHNQDCSWKCLGASEQHHGECLYVGDRQLEDVKGAGSVGMGTVWINRHGEPLDPDLPSPDYQVSSLLELAELLE